LPSTCLRSEPARATCGSLHRSSNLEPYSSI
jgi:hypothetical protein